MKKIIIIICALFPAFVFSQLGIGIKAGLNFANVTKASEIKSSNQSGFMAGIFMAPATKSVLSSRTELIYSRQGYSFNSGANTGKVNLDYIILPQLMGINITKFVQLQLGMQMAYLLNAKADSTANSGSSGGYNSIMNYYNKFDYAAGAGVEIHPVSGLLIGARYNLGLGKLYKDMQSGEAPSYASIDTKKNVIQIFAGWTFGSKTSKKK